MSPAVGPLLILAADTSGVTDVGPFVNLGAVGVLCLALIAFAKSAHADVKKQRDEAQQDLEDLNRELRTSVVPALVEANRTMLRAVAQLDERR